jgi:hypothetical protein
MTDDRDALHVAAAWVLHHWHVVRFLLAGLSVCCATFAVTGYRRRLGRRLPLERASMVVVYLILQCCCWLAARHRQWVQYICTDGTAINMAAEQSALAQCKGEGRAARPRKLHGNRAVTEGGRYRQRLHGTQRLY